MKPLIVIKRTPQIDFMRFHKYGFAFSSFLLAASIVLFLVAGLNYGIDFVGGTAMQVRVAHGAADLASMRARLEAANLGAVSLQGFGGPSDVLIRIPRQPGGDKEQAQAVEKARKALGTGIEYREIQSVGPSVGSELIRAGTIATVLALFAIAGYIWFRFEWQFGVGGMFSTLHDVVTTVGIFALLRLEFDLTTLAAILTVAGYSVNDTVVIYDRVRENLRKYRTMPFDELINLSLNETLSRTILTVSTVALAVISLLVFGGPVLRGFSIAMMWGVIIGTYSSLFIAAPILHYVQPNRAAIARAAERGTKAEKAGAPGASRQG